MKLKHLSHAVYVGLATIALTACGSSDDDINAINTAPVINPTPTLTPTTPTTTTPTTNTASLANILENAKIAGLNDANAALFAEKVKNLSFGSPEYNEALIKARQDQTDAINKALAEQAKAVSPIVDTNNPFIDNVDIREVATVSSNHYVRQQGSTYDLTANPTGIAGLGGVAIDDPTTSNPWLSNYVLGTEVVRDGDGKPTVIAIDSTGEMAEANTATADPNDGKIITGANSFYIGSNGLEYRTQRGGGNEGKYKYTTSTGIADVGNYKVRDIQAQNNQHASAGDKTYIANALLAAKDKNILAPNELSGGVPPGNTTDGQGRDLTNPSRAKSFNNYFRGGLIVYSSNSVPVGNATGKKLGYRVPMWGKEENVYQINPETDKLEVINGVDPRELEVLRAAMASEPLAFARAGSPSSLNIVSWYGSRYGSLETMTGTGNFDENGAPFTNPLAQFKQVANNDGARIYGKNSRTLETGAEGTQTSINTYIGKYSNNSSLKTIEPAILQHVQYGRLTNNIDVLAQSEVGKKGKDGNDRVIFRHLQTHGAPNSVDTYFYRGTNHTTIDQMKALGGVIQYHGHALTYNLGPYTPLDKSKTGGANGTGFNNGMPTAYNNVGASSATAGSVPTNSGNTIGNFVQAKFDVAKATLEGSIYNFINEKRSDKDEDFKKQDLATFKGVVYGNTVVGTAEKVGHAGTGSLTASFFGPNATEIGGNISSVSRAEGYGDAKWGAVFGATRGSAIEQFNVIETNNVNP